MSIKASGDSCEERADNKDSELIFVYVLPHRLGGDLVFPDSLENPSEGRISDVSDRQIRNENKDQNQDQIAPDIGNLISEDRERGNAGETHRASSETYPVLGNRINNNAQAESRQGKVIAFEFQRRIGNDSA